MNFGIKYKISITEALNEATLCSTFRNKINNMNSCILGYQDKSLKERILLYLYLHKKRRLGKLNIYQRNIFIILENEFKNLFQEK